MREAASERERVRVRGGAGRVPPSCTLPLRLANHSARQRSAESCPPLVSALLCPPACPHDLFWPCSLPQAASQLQPACAG